MAVVRERNGITTVMGPLRNIHVAIAVAPPRLVITKHELHRPWSLAIRIDAVGGEDGSGDLGAATHRGVLRPPQRAARVAAARSASDGPRSPQADTTPRRMLRRGGARSTPTKSPDRHRTQPMPDVQMSACVQSGPLRLSTGR